MKAIKIGHHQNPFLRPPYSLNSQVLSFDISPFIIDCLKANDFESIDIVMRSIVCPECDLDRKDNWLSKQINRIIKANFKKYVYFSDPQAYFELKSMLIIFSKDSGMPNFWIIDEYKLQLLAWGIVCQNPIALPNLSDLINKVNLFVLTLGFELDTWLKFPLFLEQDIQAILPIERDLNCIPVIKRLPLSVRFHLFNIFRKNSGSLPKLTTFSIRQFGIEENKSSELLLNSGLIIHTDNPEIFAKAFTKNELLSFCSNSGIQVKTSWKKTKIASIIKEKMPDLYFRIINHYHIGEINPGFKEEIQILYNHAEKIKPILSLLTPLITP